MLEPTSPQEAVELYKSDRYDELSKTTRRKYGYQLNGFVKWCEGENITNINELTGRKLHEFKLWRSKQVKPVTLKNNIWTVKNFIRFCEHIDAVSEGVHRKMRVPELAPGDEVKDNHLTKKEADAILEHLDKFEYASLRHAAFTTIWKTGMRMGTLQALDVDDFDSDRQTLRIQHRPKTGTPLKNKERGERIISLSDSVTTVLSDYLEQNHPGGTDEHDREPLIMGRDARAQKTTVQRNIYTATRPCHYTNECPHDRNPEDCEANSYNTASKCPSSCGPHALRKGYVTAVLNAGQARDVTSERTNMSRDILDKHYDKRTDEEQMEARKGHLKDI